MIDFIHKIPIKELLGIILIYLGYATMRNDKTLSVYDAQKIVVR